MIVLVCVGSSCHLKGSQEIVDKIRSAVEEHNLQDKITLGGSFCTGKCNREGVTIQIDDNVHTGITPDNFDEFFETQILDKIK